MKRLVGLILFIGMAGDNHAVWGVGDDFGITRTKEPVAVKEIDLAYVPDQLIVGYRNVPGEREMKCIQACVPDAERWHELRHAPHAKNKPKQVHPLAMVRVVHLAPGSDVAQAVERISKLSGVTYAVPNYITRAAFTPNDPFFEAEQYGPMIIRAEEAWDITTGDPAIIIAIADSGLRLDHVEFQSGLWVNVDDPPDGLDNDGNGFIDDTIGWDFMNSDNDPSPTSGHGTHVAGIAGAQINNAAGIAGMSNCTIMPLQVFNGLSGTWEAIAEAITYATDNGAHIVNYSGGGGGGAGILQTAVQYAWDNDVTVVAAAGNDGSNISYFPAAYPQTIAVSATGENDIYYTASNRGPWMDVCAPGIAVFSTWIGGPADYNYETGTSMATPHVAGLVGLMYSLNPNIQVEEVRQFLRNNAVDLGDPGFDNMFGAGRIDAKATLDAVLATIQPLRYAFPDGLPGSIVPGETTTIRVQISMGSEELDPGSPMLVYRFDGGAFDQVAMLALGGNEYEATLPAATCDSVPEFYFTATSTEESVVTSPFNAPDETYFAEVGALEIRFEDDFELDGGWESTFEGVNTTGQWVREDPIGTTAQPEDDYSEDGTICFVTGNCAGQAGTCDVDGGPVILTSPIFDLEGMEGTIEYARWFDNNNDNDTLEVEISNDGGVNWFNLETVGPGGDGGWEVVSFNVSDFVTPTASMRVRFSVADVLTVSLTEAAIDDFIVKVFVCEDMDTVSPEIVHDAGTTTFPHSGYVDSRMESSDGEAFDMGVDTLSILFSEQVRDAGAEDATLSTSAFTLMGDAPSYPSVISILSADNTLVQVELSGPVPAGFWTTIVADVEDLAGNPIASSGDQGPGVNEPDRIDIGFLPCDIDQSGVVQALDLLRFRQMFNGVFQNPEGEDLDYIDMDRNGVIQALDLLRIRQELSGTGNATQSWSGQSMSPRP